MARAHGARAQMALAFETVYGTAPASGYRTVPFASTTLGSEQPLIASELLGQGRDPLAPIKDAVTADGDVVVYDPNGHTSISAATHHMNMDHSAWEGFEIDGHVDVVISRGEVLVSDGEFHGRAGHGQYLTFRLANEEYGVDILSVQEIRGWNGATSLPESPPYLLGVINLRGSVVPIVDLRKRFDMAQAEFGPTTVCIVVRVDAPDGTRISGFVVDAVCEVYTVGDAERRPIPDAVAGRQEFVQGLATVDDKMIILLDIERLLTQAVAGASGVAQAA